jgi:hypothetical protein
MRNKICNRVTIGILTIIVQVLPFNAFSTMQEAEETITGVVKILEVDENGDPVVVGITVVVVIDDPEEVQHEEPEEVRAIYIVAPTEKGQELLFKVGRTVKATGTIKMNENNEKMILVKKFRVMA